MSTEHYLQSVHVDFESYLGDNPLHEQARTGVVDEELLKRFLVAKFQALGSESTAYGLLLHRFRDPVAVGYFSFVIHRLTESYPALFQAAGALGLDPADLPRFPVPPSLKRMGEWLAGVGLYAGAGEAALAIRVDFTVWGKLCGALAEAFRHLAVPREIVRFLDIESEVPQRITQGAVQVVEYGLAQGESEESITRSALEVVPVQAGAWEYVSEG